MRLRKQDANGDMVFGHGVADIWHDQPEGVGQNILTRLELFRGEWFLDVTEGTPWGGFPLTPQVVAQGQILGENTAFSRDMALRERVINTAGVLAITDYASEGDPNTRSFSAQMTVETIFGPLALSIRPGPRGQLFTINYSALGGSDRLG